MSPWWRFVSNMKDAVAYFGFRQVFSRLVRGRDAHSMRRLRFLAADGRRAAVPGPAGHRRACRRFSSTLAAAPAGACWWWRCFICCRWRIDAVAIRVLYRRGQTQHGLLDAVLTRWIGESANSLMPAGQLGGPVFMARYLAQRGMPMPQSAAAITVSTTLQTFAQILFALLGVLLLGARAGGLSEHALRTWRWSPAAFWRCRSSASTICSGVAFSASCCGW